MTKAPPLRSLAAPCFVAVAAAWWWTAPVIAQTVESAPATVSLAPDDAPAGESKPETPGNRCLSRSEQRARSAAKTVIPLAKAAAMAKARPSELLRARLCEENGRLVYHLTVLPRGGKVVRATVDASDGALVGQ